jgi:hypothetical protein
MPTTPDHLSSSPAPFSLAKVIGGTIVLAALTIIAT